MHNINYCNSNVTEMTALNITFRNIIRVIILDIVLHIVSMDTLSIIFIITVFILV